MAADQRKRRLNAAPALGHGTQEQHRAKKRDLRSPQYDFNFNSHVSLKWDNNGKRVVAKEDQIGMSWRHLRSFVPTAPCSNTKLADVLTVPTEVFQLNDLTGIVSYEVWQSLLTEKERGYLSQFLPRGVDTHQVVQALLGADNFHFGNPFLKWGARLCSGDLHPDAIVQHEKSFKTNKKEYYSELQQYHDDMIRNLQKLKERCARSKDPESEVQQMMSRSRRDADESILPDAKGISSLKPENGVAAMSESLSSVPDEKLYYSDNQKLSAIRDAEIQKRSYSTSSSIFFFALAFSLSFRIVFLAETKTQNNFHKNENGSQMFGKHTWEVHRIRNEEVMKDKHEKLVTSTNSLKVLPKPKKAEKPQKINISSNDGAKYMSYVKISKKQHELVKSMKQSGSSIQSKTLNRVLGNLTSFNVKPYEMFVEEEKKRIHEYWSNLANKDLPAALQYWRKRQSDKQLIVKSLLHEMEEKLRLMAEDEKSDNCVLHSEARDEKSVDYGFHAQHQDENLVNADEDENTDPEGTDAESSEQASEHRQDDESVTQDSLSDEDRESNPSSTKDESSMQNPHVNDSKEFDLSTIENQSSVQNAPLSINEDVHLSTMEHQPSMHNPPLNVNEEFNAMDLNCGNNNITTKTNETCSRTIPDHQVAPQACEASLDVCHPQSHSSAGAANAGGLPCSSVKNVWPSIGLPTSYHHAPTTQYASSSEPSFRHPQFVSSRPASLIDLRSDLRGEDTTKDLLNRHTDHMPFFNPYPSGDRNELLHSLIKRDSYQHEQKKTGLEFHPTTSVLLEQTQFPGHFREVQPSFALDNRPKAQGELLMHHNIQEGIYSDNRYPIQGPEHFPSLNVRDWTNVRLSTPIQSSQLSSAEPLCHNWFASENRAQGGWSAPESTVFSSPNLGSGSSGDQSLYSVLTQCNTLRSRAPFNPVGSTEQIIPSTNYGQELTGEIPVTSNGVLPQTSSPFDYLGGNEAALKNNMGWMSLGHHSSGLQDPSGRPFFKSWNQ
ncbi:hypothetical protein Cgig2_016567 [Carnegiea gigantea]|uniref:DEUBAD domain-containing protein n=1 Tax=Carnegiea gigantea TaxID=171969 RepID=A0A9Q1L056_9CARY|nr:hypothetical protein Cgig2_016567 [Carnegiea gigantea]